MTTASSDAAPALARFEELFHHAWSEAESAERLLRVERPPRADQVLVVLRQLARAREAVLHGQWQPGEPGGGLGLTGLVGRGLDLDGDLPEVADAARRLEQAFDSGLGLHWDWQLGRPPGWAQAAAHLPPTPSVPEPAAPAAAHRWRWGRRARRS